MLPFLMDSDGHACSWVQRDIPTPCAKLGLRSSASPHLKRGPSLCAGASTPSSQLVWNTRPIPAHALAQVLGTPGLLPPGSWVEAHFLSLERRPQSLGTGCAGLRRAAACLAQGHSKSRSCSRGERRCVASSGHRGRRPALLIPPHVAASRSSARSRPPAWGTEPIFSVFHL